MGYRAIASYARPGATARRASASLSVKMNFPAVIKHTAGFARTGYFAPTVRNPR